MFLGSFVNAQNVCHDQNSSHHPIHRSTCHLYQKWSVISLSGTTHHGDAHCSTLSPGQPSEAHEQTSPQHLSYPAVSAQEFLLDV